MRFKAYRYLAGSVSLLDYAEADTIKLQKPLFCLIRINGFFIPFILQEKLLAIIQEALFSSVS